FIDGEPLIWDSQRGDVFFRLATGDLDGDGDTDVVAGRKGNGLEVYLQNDQGQLILEQSPELAETGRAFDIRLLDLDGDGIEDIVAGFAANGGVEGGIRVWLTRPAP
ncbi:MAG: VCBS repeat-containing protein, partial [Acidobacteriota bacterium]